MNEQLRSKFSYSAETSHLRHDRQQERPVTSSRTCTHAPCSTLLLFVFVSLTVLLCACVACYSFVFAALRKQVAPAVLAARKWADDLKTRISHLSLYFQRKIQEGRMIRPITGSS